MDARTPYRIPADQEHAAKEAAFGIDPQQILEFGWKYWRSISAIAGVVCFVALVSVVAITPQYTASVDILLDPKKQKIFGAQELFPELNLDSATTDSQIYVITSSNLLRRVVEKGRLTRDPEFGQVEGSKSFGISFLWSWMFSAGLSEANVPRLSGEEDIPIDVLMSIRKLRSAIEVQRKLRTYVFTVSVTSVDPMKAARIANLVADSYVIDKLEAKYDAARRASRWLSERLEGLREQVKASEQALSEFRRANNLQTTGADSKLTLGDQQLSELNGKLVAARADTAERLAKYQQAKTLVEGGGALDTIPDVVRSTVISQLRNQQAEVSRREADLAARYSSSHPLVINVRAEKRNIDASIQSEVRRIIDNLKNDYEVSAAREASLQKSIDALSGKDTNDDDVMVKLRELERTNAANKTLFEDFLSRTKITEEQSNFQQADATIITPASRPVSPSFPQKSKTMGLALFVGLLLGTGVSLARERLNAGFSAPRQVEERLGVPVLASIPLLTSKEKKTLGSKSLVPAAYVLEKPLSRFAESVRALRVGIQMSDVDDPARVILLTSSIPQEGKSTTCISLAYSALLANQRVLVIDADMRHPSTSRFFKVQNDPGLVDVLLGSADLSKTIVSSGGLYVLGAGSKSQNPPDLLGSRRMGELISELKKSFDYIIIDTPPTGPVIDAKVAAQWADKIVFVLRWSTTTRFIAEQQIAAFKDDHKLSGVAMTMVDESRAPRYGYYSYYYRRYYKKYYQD